MSHARRVLPGTTYLVTRRCSERRFFLRPDALVNQVFKYVLAYVAAAFGVEVHAAIVLSNHFHMVITDPAQRLSKFMGLLDSLVGRCLNVARRRGEAFWSTGTSFSAVALIGEESVWEKLVYLYVNGVKAGLVRDPLDWPGFRTTPEDMLGNVVSALRPGIFFRDSMPEKTALKLTVPPALAHLDRQQVLAELKARVDAEVKQIRKARKKRKLGWLGRRGVMAQRWEDSPGGTFPTRRTNPHISCKTPGRFRREKEKLIAWRQAHREAREAWISGLRDTVFPAGTYLMHEVFGVRCEAVPDG